MAETVRRVMCTSLTMDRSSGQTITVQCALQNAAVPIALAGRQELAEVEEQVPVAGTAQLPDHARHQAADPADARGCPA